MTTIATIWILDNDQLVNISQKKYAEFYKGETNLANFAGQTIRVVVAIVETEKKKPIRIIYRNYFKYKLDDIGFIDEKHEEEYTNLLIAKASKSPSEDNNKVAYNSKTLKEQNLINKYEWKPTEKQDHMIVSRILN